MDNKNEKILGYCLGDMTNIFRERTKPRDKEYGYISTHPLTFINLIREFKKKYLKNKSKDKIKFLECGSGIGLNQLIMAYSGYNMDGIEKKKRNIDIQSKFMCCKCETIHGDILKFKGYDKYDVIYTYMPFIVEKLRLKFAKVLGDRCKSGTYVLSNDFALDNDKLKQIDTIKSTFIYKVI